MASTSTTTATHRHPRPPVGEASSPALLIAWPEPRALPIPSAAEPIGRDWFAALGHADGEISRRQLVLARRGAALTVTDAGSRNGTWLEGERLPQGEAVPLTDGALLRVGRTLLVYRTALRGGLAPDAPLGQLLSPFGLRSLRAELEGLRPLQPRAVLIEGESGTGKELLAHHVAALLRPRAALVAVNLAGVAPSLFEGHLFGWVKGAFSGATAAADGVFRGNPGAPVLLDELGDVPPELQVKLLRLLENAEVLPVGARRPVKVDNLIVAATHRPLEAMAAEGRFRHDLLARFGAARLHLPPLRHRLEDLGAILRAHLEARGGPGATAGAEVEAVERLFRLPYSTNVRELHAHVDRALTAGGGQLRAAEVERLVGAGPAARRAPTQAAIREAVERLGEREAAHELGISRGKLRRSRG